MEENMGKGKLLGTIVGLFILVNPPFVTGTEYAFSLLTGYNSGYGFQAGATVSRFAEGFPFSARLALGYTINQPGHALDARKIFINDATNGTPEKSGHAWDFRLDLLYPLSKTISLVSGVRHSVFAGNFRFVGGNEDFNVTSQQWGLGLGLEGHFRMSSRIDLVVSPGLDFYFPATLTGHDTSYSPGGENVNPRHDFTYEDADKAINQPKWVPRMMAGLAYRFGR
jgi:hypothetical protein